MPTDEDIWSDAAARAKFLAGAALLDAVDRGWIQRKIVLALVDEFLTRCDERTLQELASITGKRIDATTNAAEVIQQIRSLSTYM